MKEKELNNKVDLTELEALHVIINGIKIRPKDILEAIKQQVKEEWETKEKAIGWAHAMKIGAQQTAEIERRKTLFINEMSGKYELQKLEAKYGSLPASFYESESSNEFTINLKIRIDQ